MEFTELFIDPYVLKANVFGSCGKCGGQNREDMCTVCRNSQRYIERAFHNPCDSIVMWPPALFEQYFYPGPVTYFTVLGGYTAIIEFGMLMCNPESTSLISDTTWLRGAKPARQRAHALISAISADCTSNVLFREGVQEKNRLKIIQSMEHRIMYIQAVMEHASLKKFSSLKQDVEAAYMESVKKYLSMSLIEYTTARCGKDSFELKVLANEEWNQIFHERKSEVTTDAALEHEKDTKE